MKKINLKIKGYSYPIYIDSNTLSNFSKFLNKEKLPPKAVIITSDILSRLYLDDLIKILKKSNFDPIIEIVPDGEISKSFKQLEKSIKNISRQLNKDPFFIIAFGGGVVGDLAGFIASIYKRGVKYVQLPTTLLAQVDSSIGGKVAIDLEYGKNLIGSFYQPELVYSYLYFLKTLPAKEIKNGLAEIIKYGIIQDKYIFEILENLFCKDFQSSKNNILNKLENYLEDIIYRCSKIKSKIVASDERDTKGIRAKLNFGHTIGHSIEAASGYSGGYTHGEAVSLGMICAVTISKKMGILKEDFEDRLENMLKYLGLPIYIKDLESKDIMNFFWYDKKFVSGKPRMVLVEKLGKVKVVENISQKLVKEVIEKRIQKV